MESGSWVWIKMGYVMVCLLYSVHWYSVKYQTGSELILDVSSLKAVLVASASWSSQLTGECLVLLENGLGVRALLESETLNMARIAFAKAGSSDHSFGFLLASRSYLYLCDQRSGVPLLKWQHDVEKPCFIDVYRLSDLSDPSYLYVWELPHNLLSPVTAVFDSIISPTRTEVEGVLLDKKKPSLEFLSVPEFPQFRNASIGDVAVIVGNEQLLKPSWRDEVGMKDKRSNRSQANQSGGESVQHVEGDLAQVKYFRKLKKISVVREKGHGFTLSARHVSVAANLPPSKLTFGDIQKRKFCSADALFLMELNFADYLKRKILCVEELIVVEKKMQQHDSLITGCSYKTQTAALYAAGFCSSAQGIFLSILQIQASRLLMGFFERCGCSRIIRRDVWVSPFFEEFHSPRPPEHMVSSHINLHAKAANGQRRYNLVLTSLAMFLHSHSSSAISSCSVMVVAENLLITDPIRARRTSGELRDQQHLDLRTKSYTNEGEEFPIIGGTSAFRFARDYGRDL
uniref:Uncharacterized protein n=1 Tax=Brassica oleracea var. oleracea TaxID=109376 RepID=A0A0D3CIY4_BRAOL